MNKKERDDGNCGVARLCGKEAYVRGMGLRTGTGYKADVAGKLAPHSEALSSAAEVKPEVVCRHNAFLPGEAWQPCGDGLEVPSNLCGGSGNGSIEMPGVSRGHSNHRERAGSSLWAKDPEGLSDDEGPNHGGGSDRLGL